jgi:hypothetical protein
LPFHHSEEAKKSISEKHKREVKCIETQQIFNSLSAAAEWANLSSTGGISQCCNGKRKTAGGYHWEFVAQA